MPTSAHPGRVLQLAVSDPKVTAELRLDPRGSCGSWRWAKAGADGMQGQVCHQLQVKWASQDLTFLPATPRKTSEAGAWRGFWNRHAPQSKGSTSHTACSLARVYMSKCGLQTAAPKPPAKAAEKWRLTNVIGVLTPRPRPLLPPLQIPIGLTSLPAQGFSATPLTTYKGRDTSS